MSSNSKCMGCGQGLLAEGTACYQVGLKASASHTPVSRLRTSQPRPGMAAPERSMAQNLDMGTYTCHALVRCTL